MSMVVQSFTMDMFEQVKAIWTICGFSLKETDVREKFENYVKLNPDTSLIGMEDGKVVACVFGGFNGSVAIVKHLAVLPEYRKNDFGLLIMTELEKRLKAKGVAKIMMWVERSNESVAKFYEKQGYKIRTDIFTMSKTI